jgi:uncharacterized OB-fold protein
MKCTKCGQLNKDDARICVKCGAGLEMRMLTWKGHLKTLAVIYAVLALFYVLIRIFIKD